MLCTFWVAAADAGHRGVQGEREECQAEARTAASCGGDAVFGSNSGELFTYAMFQLWGRCCAW